MSKIMVNLSTNNDSCPHVWVRTTNLFTAEELWDGASEGTKCSKCGEEFPPSK